MEKYIPKQWVSVSYYYLIDRIMSAVPNLDYITVSRILDKYSDGTFYDFEVRDWILFFKKKMYLPKFKKEIKQ